MTLTAEVSASRRSPGVDEVSTDCGSAMSDTEALSLTARSSTTSLASAGETAAALQGSVKTTPEPVLEDVADGATVPLTPAAAVAELLAQAAAAETQGVKAAAAPAAVAAAAPTAAAAKDKNKDCHASMGVRGGTPNATQQNLARKPGRTTQQSNGIRMAARSGQPVGALRNALRAKGDAVMGQLPDRRNQCSPPGRVQPRLPPFLAQPMANSTAATPPLPHGAAQHAANSGTSHLAAAVAAHAAAPTLLTTANGQPAPSGAVFAARCAGERGAVAAWQEPGAWATPVELASGAPRGHAGVCAKVPPAYDAPPAEATIEEAPAFDPFLPLKKHVTDFLLREPKTVTQQQQPR